MIEERKIYGREHESLRHSKLVIISRRLLANDAIENNLNKDGFLKLFNDVCVCETKQTAFNCSATQSHLSLVVFSHQGASLRLLESLSCVEGSNYLIKVSWIKYIWNEREMGNSRSRASLYIYLKAVFCPNIISVEFERWKYSEMILSTYESTVVKLKQFYSTIQSEARDQIMCKAIDSLPFRWAACKCCESSSVEVTTDCNALCEANYNFADLATSDSVTQVSNFLVAQRLLWSVENNLIRQLNESHLTSCHFKLNSQNSQFHSTLGILGVSTRG